jgi:hypothetical protein
MICSSNVFFIIKKNPDPNPDADPKLRLKPGPNTDTDIIKKIISDPQHCMDVDVIKSHGCV